MGQVIKMHTKLNDEKAFQIFLMNLYYELSNDNDFIDILTNAKSKVEYTLYSDQFGKMIIDSKRIRKHLLAFTECLGHSKLESIYKSFLSKNKIQLKNVG